MITPIDHTADAGFEILSSTQKKLFLEAANAVISILYDSRTIDKQKIRKVSISATALDILFHDFLSEILQIAQYELFLIAEIDIENIDDRSIEAKIFGEPFDSKKHEFFTEIKAITYHRLAAEPRGGKWFGRFIVDL